MMVKLYLYYGFKKRCHTFEGLLLVSENTEQKESQKTFEGKIRKVIKGVHYR